MDLRQLGYFVAIAEELHFGRAAERLHMSQPPLSRTIRMMEEQLGAKLFARTNRRVALTAAGYALLRDARVILERVAEAEKNISHIAAGGVDSLEIGYLGAASFGDVMPPLLARFHRAWPNVRLMLRQMTTEGQMEALSQGRLDIGFARPPNPEMLPPGIAAYRVQREPLVLALSCDHPLAGSVQIEIAALKHEPFVIVARHISPGIHYKVYELCAHAGFTPRVVAEVHEITAILSLVVAGVGVAPVVAGIQRVGIAGLAFAEITDDRAFVDMLLVYREQEETPTVRNFLDLI